jgi:hypothetical protein
MTQDIKLYRQGNLDNLCGIYSTENAVLKSTNGLAKFTKKQAKIWFQLIISDLSKRRKLFAVHKEGSEIELVEGYLGIIQSQLADNIKLSFYKPFNDKTRTSTAIKKISTLTKQPNTAVIIGIQGLHDHWSVVDRITVDRIYLNDSDGLRFLRSSNIPRIYDLTVEDTIVVKAESACNLTIPRMHSKKTVQTKSNP